MKDANLVVRIPSATKEQLQAHAAKNGLTASSLTLALIDEELNTQSLSNIYFSITKRFENVDERFVALAKGLERALGAMEKLEVLNEKDHKAINRTLTVDADVLNGILKILTKPEENSVTRTLNGILNILAKVEQNSATKDQLLRLVDLVTVLAKGAKP